MVQWYELWRTHEYKNTPFLPLYGLPGRIVEQWNGGTVERWNGGTVERWNGEKLDPWNSGTVDQWHTRGTVACKQALRIGYSEVCFRIARGREREKRARNGPCTIWVLPPCPLLALLLDSTKIAMVAHSNRKTRTTQADISIKKSENYCLKAKPWMGTSFPNFLYVI